MLLLLSWIYDSITRYLPEGHPFKTHGPLQVLTISPEAKNRAICSCACGARLGHSCASGPEEGGTGTLMNGLNMKPNFPEVCTRNIPNKIIIPKKGLITVYLKKSNFNYYYYKVIVKSSNFMLTPSASQQQEARIYALLTN